MEGTGSIENGSPPSWRGQHSNSPSETVCASGNSRAAPGTSVGRSSAESSWLGVAVTTTMGVSVSMDAVVLNSFPLAPHIERRYKMAAVASNNTAETKSTTDHVKTMTSTNSFAGSGPQTVRFLAPFRLTGRALRSAPFGCSGAANRGMGHRKHDGPSELPSPRRAVYTSWHGQKSWMPQPHILADHHGPIPLTRRKEAVGLPRR